MCAVNIENVTKSISYMYNACRVNDDVYIAPLTVAHDHINHQVASVIQIHVVEYVGTIKNGQSRD